MTADAREFDVHTGPRGLRLRVSAWGTPTADTPTIVVLHGFLEQSAAWDAVAKRLAPRHVVAPDHRGHGLSDHVGEGGFYHFWDYVADVDAVIDEVSDGPVDLVGHSMGGSIATLVAACVPEKIRRLVLVEGLGPPDGEPRVLEQARRALRHRRRPPRHRRVIDVEDAVTRMMRGNPDLPVEAARRLAARQTESDPSAGEDEAQSLRWTWDALHRARSPQAFSAARQRVFLEAIEAPTLMIEGGTSPYRFIPDLDARRAALAEARTVVIEDCGHHPHHTHPDRLAALILEHCHVGA